METNYSSGMSKSEVLMVSTILGFIFLLGFFNLQISERRARDVQRKNDLKHVAAALNSYLYDFGAYPASVDGRIFACGTPEHVRVCVWAADGITDLSDPDYPPYINPLPQDPLASTKDYTYIYLSNTRNFQLFASLENSSEAEYNKDVFKRGIKCGSSTCNFGISSIGSPKTPLEVQNPNDT